MQPREIGDDVVDAAGHQPDFAHLLQHVDAEPPLDAVHVHHVGEVAAAVFVKDLAGAVVHHGKQQPHHFFGIHRAAIERPQLAPDPHHRRAADLHVQVAAFQLHQCAEELVDLQFAMLASKSHRIAELASPSSVAKRFLGSVRRMPLPFTLPVMFARRLPADPRRSTSAVPGCRGEP